VLKIPAHMFGLDSSNMKLQELNDLYLKNTLNPYLKSLTSEIIFKTCDKKTKYTFNTDSFKYIDPQTKTEITKDKISNGIITLNEARRDYGLEEQDGEMFDTHYMNLNHVPLEALEQFQLNKTKNAPISGNSGDSSEDSDEDTEETEGSEEDG